MQIDSKDLAELQKIHFEETGQRLNDEQTLEMGTRLLTLFKVLLKPIEINNSSEDKNE